MKYLLGTGRYKLSRDLEYFWDSNRAPVAPAQIVKFEVGGFGYTPNKISVEGNLGHVGQLLSGEKPYDFCGWSASFMQLATTAYCAECDFLYKEQDCLAFGPWVQQMYADMGDGDMVFGGQMKSAPFMPSAQSLVLIRHWFIPHFIWRYLGMGKDGDINNLPEHKFAKMLAAEPKHFRTLSFGVDRERPLPYDAPVWYAQKFTPEELFQLIRRDMLPPYIPNSLSGGVPEIVNWTGAEL